MRREKLSDAGGRWSLICNVVLFLCCLALSWKVLTLNADSDWQPRGILASGLARLATTDLRFPDDVMRIEDLGHRYVELTIFTPGDCPPTLGEIGNGDVQYGRPHGRLGIMSYGSSEEVQQTKENLGLILPILADPAGDWLARLRPPQTPWVALLDLQSRQVIRQGEIPSRPERSTPGDPTWSAAIGEAGNGIR